MDEYERETQTLRELLEVMHEHDLDRIKVKLGDAVYEVVRREGQSVATLPAMAPARAPGDASAPAPVAAANVKKVVAPLTGVFYCAPSPDAEPYVSVGDRVEKGGVVCVLEAMKLFNEIQSEYAGTVVRIVPTNGELVSQGDDLLWIEP